MPTVSVAVVDSLTANGIDTVFGVPGTQSLPLNEGIDAHGGIRFVMARHETAVPHQAWGYAETSGNPAATVVIPGPGDMNAMNGLKNALNDCTPLVHIAVETDPHVRGGDGIHETPPDTYDNVVKQNVTVENPENTIAELERLIAISQTPPKGPVRLGIPKSFLTRKVPLTEPGSYSREGIRGVPEGAVDEAADLLDSADRPLIVAGGGVRVAEATRELQSMAETLGAPVVPTYKGKGVFPEDHDLYAGILSVGSSEHLLECIAESDVALAVGTDLDAVTTGEWSVKIPDDLIHITLEADDIAVGYQPAIGIAADAEETLQALADRLGSVQPRDGASRARTVRESDAELMADVLGVSTPPLTSASAEAALNDVLDRDTIVTVDAGGFRIWALHVIDSYSPRTFVDTGSWASMGTALPSAIGAKLANPDRDIVGLMGGGGLMMCVHELHTVVAEDIPIVIVVLNNNDYATISAEAADSFDLDEGVYEWEGTPIQFRAIAEAMGLESELAETPSAIRTAVTDALDGDRPILIEIPTDPREPQAKPLD